MSSVAVRINVDKRDLEVAGKYFSLELLREREDLEYMSMEEDEGELQVINDILESAGELL